MERHGNLTACLDMPCVLYWFFVDLVRRTKPSEGEDFLNFHGGGRRAQGLLLYFMYFIGLDWDWFSYGAAQL